MDSLLRDQMAASADHMERIRDPSAPWVRAMVQHVDLLSQALAETQAVRQPQATFTDDQVDAIAQRLISGCKAWSQHFARSSDLRSRALLALAGVVILVMGVAIGWRLFAAPPGLVCADQADGSRLCYVYTRPPQKVAR
jgi:hypothetical protein